MTSDPDVLAWMTSLSAEVVPDEVDLAQDVAAAYLRGGIDRRRLFAAPRSDPGAFGGGLALSLPYVLDSLATCFGVVKSFVGDSAVNTTVASASLAVALRQMRAARIARTAAAGATDAADATAATNATAATDAAADPQVVERARDALSSLVSRLHEHPETAGSPEDTAAAILTVVAADPVGALRALGALDDAPP